MFHAAHACHNNGTGHAWGAVTPPRSASLVTGVVECLWYIYIYYYTPLPLNLANKQATSNKHVTIPFWPLHLPNASGLTLL